VRGCWLCTKRLELADRYTQGTEREREWTETRAEREKREREEIRVNNDVKTSKWEKKQKREGVQRERMSVFATKM